MTAQRHDRPAFRLSMVVVALAVVLVGIVSWKVLYRLDLIPAGHSQAAAIRSEIFYSAKLTIGVPTIVAVAVGTGCYFAFGRSPRAANTSGAIVLALPVAMLSFQAYRAMTHSPQTIQQSPGAAASPPTFGNSLSEQLKQQADRDRRALEQLATRPSPAQLLPSSPTPPTTHTPPSTTPPTPTPRPAPPAAPAKQANPNIAPALARVKDSIVAQISESLARVEPVLATLDKAPKANKAAIQKRLDDVKSARQTLSALSESLQGMIDRARTEAEQAGAEPFEAHSEAIRFTNAFDSSRRRFASDALGRILEQAEQECDLLLTNFGLWKIGSDGKVDAKDFTLKSRAQSARFFIETGLKTKDREIGKLKAE